MPSWRSFRPKPQPLPLTPSKASSRNDSAQGNDTIAVRQILPITIAMDHRALDYGDIIPFMRKLDEIFANAEVLKQWK